ncbi:MAG TPA: NADH-quinone oxidoreductase subunit J [Blastocatellia bacterium]|nr:NADH-quinone oxidoreductase subunit J [Blastocatellia bacterium]
MIIIFLFLALVAVVGAFNVILHRNPIYSAISLVAVMCALAGLFLTLGAQFIGAMQVIVYAGAIMVLFVFVIMLLNVRTEEAKLDRAKYLGWLAVPLFVALLGQVLTVINALPNKVPPAVNPAAPAAEQVGTAESIGSGMFTDYLFPFEATSVLILMAIVGSLFLAQRRAGGRAATTDSK